MATHDILHLIQLCEIKLWKELKEKKKHNSFTELLTNTHINLLLFSPPNTSRQNFK